MQTARAALVVVPLLVSTSEAQRSGWFQAKPATAPAERSNSAMAFDSVRKRTVLFGGYGSPTTFHFFDTWEWDGKAWIQQPMKASPPGRFFHAMAYDSVRKRTVLFGGLGYPLLLSDTWEWDGKTWSQIQATVSPSGRFGHAMIFDTARQRTVLFGGYSNIGRLADTWEWDGKTWKKVTSSKSPGERDGHSMAYDSVRKRTVLFGGWHSGPLRDTWEWDGNTWTPITPTTKPPARHRSAMVYDSVQQRTVLFGGWSGNSSSGAPVSDTWEWDGKTWLQIKTSVSPSARESHAMVHDSYRQRTLLFGGWSASSSGNSRLGDTWEYRYPAPPSYAPFGAGCAGKFTPPTLKSANLPRIGQSFTLEVGNLKPTTGGVIMIGDSDKTWSGTPLPLDLSIIAMPGCKLYISWISEVGIYTVPGGTAVWKGTLPADPTLVGREIFNQAWVQDSSANVLGVATSNGCKGVIGF